MYIVGAGDLGITASDLDKNLTQIFRIASSWGAIVLIDEADVFMEQRSVHDLQRNAIVAVFLCHLEYVARVFLLRNPVSKYYYLHRYFQGTHFLTTNRVKTFDKAFQSRIHLSLRYPDLDPGARRKIWVAFLKKATAGGQDRLAVSEAEIEHLSEWDVNGRQIKNIVWIASIIASDSDKKQLPGYKLLVFVLDTMAQFDE